MATIQELEAALVKADAAGNAADAKAFADAIRQMRQQAPAAPRDQSSGLGIRDLILGKPREMPLSDQLVRAGGLGVRDMIQGGMGTLGILSDPLAKGFELATGIQTPTAREAGISLADSLGLPTPQNAYERVGGQVTEALTGSAGFIGAGRNLAGMAPSVMQRVGEMLASQPGLQLASAAAGSTAAGHTRESGGTPNQQLAAGLVGGLAPVGIVSGGAQGLRYALRGGAEGRKQMEDGISNFYAVGADPSVGQATGNRRTQGLESLLSGGPTSAIPMASAAERQADDIGASLRARADNFFQNASAERAGSAIEKGVGKFVGKVKDMRSVLYDKADKLIPGVTPTPLVRTVAALQDMITPTAGAESTSKALMNPKIVALAQDIGQDLGPGGAIPYSAVRDIRSKIGAALSDFSLTTDKPTAEYKRLYAALSQDLEEAARRQGPEASQAISRANAYYKASQSRLEQIERVVDKAGGPEKVYQAAISGTQDGGTTLRAVLQSLPKDGQRAVTGAVIKRMGLPTPGQAGVSETQFSAQTFLTSWNKLSPESRRALFDRHGPRFVSDMNKIAAVSERIAKGSKVFANPSGSGKLAGGLVYASSLAGAILTGQIGLAGATAAGGGAAYALSKAMTNPRFVAWLAKGTELPVSAATQQAIALKRIAEVEGDQELAAIAESLRQERNDK